MDNHHQEKKKEFQIERIAFFSDAVFAIAITLLIIDIKIPEVEPKDISDLYLLNHVLMQIPKFIGFFVSFFVIGLYWFVHHRMFKHIIHYNRKLLSTNLFFLSSIALMPYSSAFLSNYFLFPVHVPLAFYTLNLFFTGWMTFRLWKLIGNPKYQLSEGLNNKILLRYNTIRSFIIPIIFAFVLIISFFSQFAASFILPFLPIVTMLVNKHYKKRYPEIIHGHLGH
jgi:uncharacterized membrane protein